MANEADTRWRFIVPKLPAAGWDNEPYSISGQRTFTDGRIVVHGQLWFNILDYTGVKPL
jgi:type I restriction enzyme R subunit